ncbi:MAG: hypothetical protein NTZ78_07270 [Candidatus Aureabacteria bacterium]|nr:hypothetical protein [Candidatus Auribacterota bacterium]
MGDVQGREFTRDRAGWIIVILNLVMAANSTFYFIAKLGAGLTGWLAMNSCAPSIFIFSVGYLLRHRLVMAVGAGLMFRYGTLGLFVFGWQGMNLIPQAGHILMTMGVLYFILRMLRQRSLAEIIVAGAVALVLMYADWQASWFASHPGVLDRLMDGTLDARTLR